MISVNFNLRNPNEKKETPINCKIRYSGKVLTVPTQLKVLPSRWSVSKQKIKGTSQIVTEKNKTLEKIKKAADLEYQEFINEYEYEPDPQQLKEAILSTVFGIDNEEGETIPKEFFAYIEYFIKTLERTINPKTQRRISARTIGDYRNLAKRLKEFEDNTRTQLSFKSLDLSFYLGFREYLEGLQYRPNTVGKYIKNLKSVLSDATANGVNNNLKYKSKKWVKPQEETKEIHLNEERIVDLENLDLSHKPSLDRARDLFLILCYTGQRYQSLRDVVSPKNRNNQNLELTQGKENNKVVIPILAPLQKIFDKYEKINVISNAKLNQYIKEICKLIPSYHERVDVKFTKEGKKVTRMKPLYGLVCTHTGRRSFATNFYERGYPIATIMSVTGHKKESTFFKYIRTTPEDHAAKFRELYHAEMSRNNLNVV